MLFCCCTWTAQALFTVYDGHGKEGDLCAVFCKDTLPGVLSKDLRESRTVEDGLKKAFNRTNDQVEWIFGSWCKQECLGVTQREKILCGAHEVHARKTRVVFLQNSTLCEYARVGVRSFFCSK